MQRNKNMETIHAHTRKTMSKFRKSDLHAFTSGQLCKNKKSTLTMRKALLFFTRASMLSLGRFIDDFIMGIFPAIYFFT